jgi:hypothetical protein
MSWNVFLNNHCGVVFECTVGLSDHSLWGKFVHKFCGVGSVLVHFEWILMSWNVFLNNHCGVVFECTVGLSVCMH